MMNLSGCSHIKSFFSISSNPSEGSSAPIRNPFGEAYQPSNSQKQNIILRTKKGDRAVEVELPSGDQAMTDFVVPVSPAFKEPGRSTSSISDQLIDESYKQRAPSAIDKEITNTFAQGSTENEGKRREIEQDLGLVTAEDSIPEGDTSYLAAIDHIKQLFRLTRYEAALLEIDQLLHQYQTSSKLYEMRGTILDRLGYTDLALKSWTQALRLDPKNQPLRNFLERKHQKGTGGATP